MGKCMAPVYQRSAFAAVVPLSFLLHPLVMLLSEEERFERG